MKLKTSLATLFLAVSSGTVFSATVFSVNADSNAFTGWTEGNTSGNSSLNGRYLGSSTVINTPTQAWGLYANTSNTAANTYVFGGGALAVGQTVSITITLGNIASGGTVGFGLQNSSSINRFESYYIGNHVSDTWKLNDAGGQENITGPNTSFANTSRSNSKFATISFTQLGSNAFSLSFNGTPVTNSGLTITASDIDRIRIFNFNAGSGGASDQFFNSLSVVPEPSAALLGAIGALALLRRRRI
jgi:hypothetical protein